MELGIEGRVAAVTGSSRGIGRAVARQFAAAGARVVITYRSRRDLAERVAAEIRDGGGEAIVSFFDLASDEAIRGTVDAAFAQWGRVDILVNNAVVWASRMPSESPPFEDLPSAEWRPLLRANLEGAFRTIQAVLPAMRERRWGRIVNISSGVAADGLPGSSWYAAAKAALHGLTRTLARELGAYGILTNVVMPGFTLTERVVEMVPDAVRDEVARSSPIGRLLTPDEVARTIVFLGSAANTAINGEIIRASGGIT